MMEFRILGPLEVTDDGRSLELGATKQQTLLAVLLLHPGEVVSPTRLMHELWGEAPPASGAKAVQVYVSGLRRLLGAETIVTRTGGYLLEPAWLDAAEFERLATLEQFRDALALWRASTVLQGIEFEGLRRQRGRAAGGAAAGGARAARRGRPRARPPRRGGRRARGADRRPPVPRAAAAQLMLALYRCDRQADALQAYQDARAQLVDELGIEPGERLRELERRDPRAGPGARAAGDRGAAAPPAAPRAAPGRPARAAGDRRVARAGASPSGSTRRRSTPGWTRCARRVDRAPRRRVEGSPATRSSACSGPTRAARGRRAARRPRAPRASCATERPRLELGDRVRRGVRRRRRAARGGEVFGVAAALEARRRAGRDPARRRASHGCCATPCGPSRPSRGVAPARARAGERRRPAAAGPFVDRERELDALRAAFAEPRDERACRRSP